MSFFKNALKTIGKVALDVASESLENAKKQQYQQTANSGTTIGGKTVQQWDREWRSIGTLASLSLTPYNKSVGLYRAKLGGRVVYIGRAIEWNNGGFRKRLSDYTRDSSSARK